MSAVPEPVLAAFDVGGRPEPLSGGMGQSVRVGDVVLKPAGDEAEASWLAQLQHDLRPVGLRTPRPRRAADGRWVVDGWSATAYLAGDGRPGRWADTMAAGRALHAALRAEPRPELLDRRTHRWAVADRVAWGEATADLGPVGERLTARRRPLDLPRQLVHCDLSGNVLFHDSEPPAVIDLSLYWRPPPYAEAIVAVDAFLWYDAEPGVLDMVEHEHATQLLLRATVFRLCTDLSPEHQGERTPASTFEQLADRLAAR